MHPAEAAAAAFEAAAADDALLQRDAGRRSDEREEGRRQTAVSSGQPQLRLVHTELLGGGSKRRKDERGFVRCGLLPAQTVAPAAGGGNIVEAQAAAVAALRQAEFAFAAQAALFDGQLVAEKAGRCFAEKAEVKPFCCQGCCAAAILAELTVCLEAALPDCCRKMKIVLR